MSQKPIIESTAYGLATAMAIFIGLMTLGGCSLLFPREAGEEMAHFATSAPQVGQWLPDVELLSSAGEPTSLHQLLAGGKPVVLRVGSHSCPVFRYRQHYMGDLYQRYAGKVRFVTLYTLEAHPVGSHSPYRDEVWNPLINRLTGVSLDQPSTVSERLNRARWSANAMKNPDLILVDGMDDAAWQALGAAPSPAYVLDGEGRIVFRQVWLDPSAVGGALDALLKKTEKPTAE